MNHRRMMLVAALVMALPVAATAGGIPITIHRNPNCGCCDAYAAYLEGEGFSVERVDAFDPAPLHRKHGVPEALEGCHTAEASGYVFEGLVPAQHIKQVLEQRRPIRGLSVPGMPTGAPGMPGPKTRPINVYYLDASSPPKVFATF